MNVKVTSLLAILASGGCQHIESLTQQSSRPEVSESMPASEPAPLNRNYSVYSPYNHNKALNDYAEQIVMQLRTRGRFDKPIAVTSFVEFDESLANTNSLGNQLSEAVLIEMSAMGYPMADITAARKIRVNADGSFAFSRDAHDVADSLCCVVSGNLIYERRGVRVNTKLFELENKQVLASSSLLIPYFVAEQYGQVIAR